MQLTIKEASKRTGIPVRTICSWIESGDLEPEYKDVPITRIQKVRVIDMEDLKMVKSRYRRSQEALDYHRQGKSFEWIAEHMGNIKVKSAQRLVRNAKKREAENAS